MEDTNKKLQKLLKSNGPIFIDDTLEMLDILHELVCCEFGHDCLNCHAMIRSERGELTCPFDAVRARFVSHFYLKGWRMSTRRQKTTRCGQ